jgi:hypothetical protein
MEFADLRHGHPEAIDVDKMAEKPTAISFIPAGQVVVMTLRGGRGPSFSDSERLPPSMYAIE